MLLSDGGLSGDDRRVAVDGGLRDSGATGVGGDVAVGANLAAKVAISEIMYHPVKEPGADEIHEFIELYNKTDSPVIIGGWKIDAVGYAFPTGSMLAAKSYAVVAKNPSELAKVSVYMLNPASLFGPYPGDLDNGGERVVLSDNNDNVMDALKFDDQFPWPIGADALGASDWWLRADSVPGPFGNEGAELADLFSALPALRWQARHCSQ